MSNVGYATFGLIPSAKGLGRALDNQIGPAADSAGRRGGTLAGAGLLSGARSAVAPIAGVLAGVFAAGAVVSWGKESINALKRIETINAQTASAIKATGAAAGVTTDHVEDLANSLEKVTSTEAESIQEGANLLLTFKAIRNEAGAGNDIFDQTVRAMVDMSRAMGTDASSGAIQLGKALNDPVAGISALSRVGIQFTDDQKALIGSLVESGQTMEAQKIILAELNAQFGGSGAAYADTYAGKIDNLGNAWGNVGETIFAAVLPGLGQLADFGAERLTWLTDSPLLQTWVAGLQGRIDLLLYALNQIQGAEGGFSFENVRTQLENAFPGLKGVFDVLAAVGPALPLVAAALTSVGTALMPVLPGLQELGGQALAELVPLLRDLGPVLLDSLVALMPALLQLIPPLTDLLVAILPPLASMLGTALPPAVALVTGALQVLTPILSNGISLYSGILAAAGEIAAFLSGDQSWNTTVGNILNADNAFGNIITTVSTFASGVARNIQEAVGWFASLPGEILSAVGSLGTTLYSAGRDVIRGFLNGVESMASWLADAVLAPIKDAVNGVTSFLGINSPSKLFTWIGHSTGEGMALGITKSAGLVARAADSLIPPTGGYEAPSLTAGGMLAAQADQTMILSDIHTALGIENLRDDRPIVVSIDGKNVAMAIRKHNRSVR